MLVDPDEVVEQFRAGIRLFRPLLLKLWINKNWSTLYNHSDVDMAADLMVERGNVGKWRRGYTDIGIDKIDLCQIYYESRARELGIDPVGRNLRLQQYEPGLWDLLAVGYIHAMACLVSRKPMGLSQFQCLDTMIASRDWQVAFAVGNSEAMERIAPEILASAKGAGRMSRNVAKLSELLGPMPCNLADLRALYIEWREPWDIVREYVNINIGNK